MVIPPGLVVPVHPCLSCRTCYREKGSRHQEPQEVPAFGFCLGRTILHPPMEATARGNFRLGWLTRPAHRDETGKLAIDNGQARVIGWMHYSLKESPGKPFSTGFSVRLTHHDSL